MTPEHVKFKMGKPALSGEIEVTSVRDDGSSIVIGTIEEQSDGAWLACIHDDIAFMPTKKSACKILLVWSQ